MKPYTDIIIDDGKIRTFDTNCSDGEYEWHRDHNNREIEILEGNGWLLQFDNELPKHINIGDKIYIPMGVFHRVFKGNTNLKIKIREMQ